MHLSAEKRRIKSEKRQIGPKRHSIQLRRLAPFRRLLCASSTESLFNFIHSFEWTHKCLISYAVASKWEGGCKEEGGERLGAGRGEHWRQGRVIRAAYINSWLIYGLTLCTRVLDPSEHFNGGDLAQASTSWLLHPKPSVDTEGTLQGWMFILHQGQWSGVWGLNRNGDDWHPQGMVWVRDLANAFGLVGLSWVSPPPHRILSPRKWGEEWNLKQVRSSTKGIWFPEIKNKSKRKRAPLEAEPSCARWKHMLTFKKPSAPPWATATELVSWLLRHPKVSYWGFMVPSYSGPRKQSSLLWPGLRLLFWIPSLPRASGTTPSVPPLWITVWKPPSLLISEMQNHFPKEAVFAKLT